MFAGIASVKSHLAAKLETQAPFDPVLSLLLLGIYSAHMLEQDYSLQPPPQQQKTENNLRIHQREAG